MREELFFNAVDLCPYLFGLSLLHRHMQSSWSVVLTNKIPHYNSHCDMTMLLPSPHIVAALTSLHGKTAFVSM